MNKKIAIVGFILYMVVFCHLMYLCISKPDYEVKTIEVEVPNEELLEYYEELVEL